MWVYEQGSGRLYSPDGLHAGTGYAGGNCGKNKEAINNHAMQGEKNKGPLPCGVYTFGDVVLKSHLGPFAIPLNPEKSNNMLGRSAFYVHGDTTPTGNASEGCIILPRAVRNEMYESADHQLAVVYVKGGL